MSTYGTLMLSILEELNLLRNCPKEYSARLTHEFSNYKANNIRHRRGTVPLNTREGLLGIKSAYEDLQKVEKLPILEWSSGLSTVALSHCEDTGRLGIVGHVGSTENNLKQRLEKFGKWSGSVVEALDYGSVSAFEVVLSLIIDDGLATRPHRKAILNPNFKFVGIGAAPHSEFKTVVCIIFAAGFVPNEHIPELVLPTQEIPKNPEIEDWLEGAVKVTCEIREEYEKGKKIKRIKKHWEMSDGSFISIDDLVEDKIEEIEKSKKSTEKDLQSWGDTRSEQDVRKLEEKIGENNQETYKVLIKFSEDHEEPNFEIEIVKASDQKWQE